MIQLELKDVRGIEGFFPEATLREFNKALAIKVKKICRKHQETFVKIASIDDEEFKEMEWGYKCDICGVRLRPILFEVYE